MNPKEVDSIITDLREAAEQLAFVRGELDNIDWKVKGKLTPAWKLRQQVFTAVAHAESAIRVALAPVGSSRGEAGNLN